MTREPRQPSSLLPALLGLGIVTAALGAVAFWYALSARGLNAEIERQRSALATAQVQMQAEATRAAAVVSAAATEAAAAAAQIEDAQRTSQAYSRIVRANQLANNALLALESKPQAALLLAIEAMRVQTENGEQPLAESVQRLRSLLGTTGGIPLPSGQTPTTALAVSRDERFAAAGDEEGFLRIWDLADTDAPPLIVAAHDGPLWDLAFIDDSRRLVSAGEDGALRIWNVATGAGDTGAGDTGAGDTVSLLLYAGDAPFYALALAPNGAQLAAAAADGSLLLWQVSDLQAAGPAPQRLSGHTDAVNSLAFSPDGRLLASAGDDTSVRLWDPAQGEQVAALEDPGGFVNRVIFSPDGSRLAAGGSAGEVRLWTLADLTQPSARLVGHELAVYALAFSPDSRFLASAGDEGEVRLWPVAQPQAGLLLGQHNANVRGLAFVEGASGPLLVSAGYDGEVRLWDYANPAGAATVVRGHDGAINLLAAPPAPVDGPLSSLLVSAGYDHSLRLWRMTDPFAEPDRVLVAGGPVAEVLVAADGQRLVSMDVDVPIVRLWDWESGVVLRTLVLNDSPHSAIAVSSDGQRIWTGSQTGAVAAFTAHDGALEKQLIADGSAVRVLAESLDGSLLAVGREDGTIELWDIGQEVLRHNLAGHAAPLTGLSFAGDGHTLVSAGQDGELRLWDVASGALQEVFGAAEQGLWDVAAQPSGPWLVGAGGDGAVWVWNADAPAFEPAQLRRHRNEVNAVNFSADGAILGSAGADAAVYLWNAANPSAEPDSLLGHGSSVNSLAFAPDGAWVVTASSDGTIRRWSLSSEMLMDEACRTAGRNLTLEEWTQYFPTSVDQYRKSCPLLAGP